MLQSISKKKTLSTTFGTNKGFKGVIYLCDVSTKDADLAITWIQLMLYKPDGEEIPSNSDIILDYCNFLKPFEHYKDFAEFVDELIENMD